MHRAVSVASMILAASAVPALAQKERAHDTMYQLQGRRTAAQVASPYQIQDVQGATPLAAPSLDAGLTWRRPPEPWNAQDSAYYDYRRAVTAIDDGQFKLAATYFGKIHREYPRSVYAADAYYWHAFSLYRLGGADNLRTAVTLLDTQHIVYPRARTTSDGFTLATRMRGELAKAGDAAALHELADAMGAADECTSTGVNVKIAALSAFQQIDPAMTVRYLRDVFFRPNRTCSNYLQQQSVFILAQIDSPEAMDLMLSVAGRASNIDVQVDAIRWLAETPDMRAVALLENILRTPSPSRLQESALAALFHQSAMVDAALFREIAASRYMPDGMRELAVEWLGEQRLNDNSNWLVRLYESERSSEVRRALVSAVAAQRDLADRAWFLGVARDTTATVEIRKLAIKAAADLQTPSVEFYKLYRDVRPSQLRQQIIDVLGRHREKMAVDRLIDIVAVEAESAIRGFAVNWLRQSKDERAVAFMVAYRER